MSRVGLILEICSVGFWHTGVCGDELSLVGTCIALFGLNCCLAGRSDACKAADI